MANELNKSLGFNNDNAANLEGLDKQEMTAALSNMEEYLKRVAKLKKKGVVDAEKVAAQEAVLARQAIYEDADKKLYASLLREEADAIKASTDAQKSALQQRMNDELLAAGTNANKRKAIAEKYQNEIKNLEATSRTAEYSANKAQWEKEKEERKRSRELGKNVQNADGSISYGAGSSGNAMQRLKETGTVGFTKAATDFRGKEESYRDEQQAAIERAVEIEKLLADGNLTAEEQSELQKELVEATKESQEASLKAVAAGIAAGVQDKYKQMFNEVEELNKTSIGHFEAALQGSDKNYKDIMDKVTSNVSVSPFVSAINVIENMREAVDQGIVYNLEQRAFLQTMTDKIATTFDAFDSNLLRIVRLQQADSTAARMGMEASLTKFFNGMFEDNSYLHDMADTVSGAILEATSMLSRNAAAEFDYVVQKWMGSLYSVGASADLINNISQGLSYLATGDVTSLSNNESIQTLMAMSASRAGLEYSKILLDGLDSQTTNKLLESMVEYLKEIAEQSDSQVIRAAYGDIFNMNLSDMKAITNLSSSDISNISSSLMSYGDMQTEIANQMSFANLAKRSNIASMLTTAYENAIYGVATDIVNNPVTYSMTKMLDFMESNEIDMAIPFVNAAGFGLDLNTSVQDIMRLGLGVGQAFSLMGNILAGLGSSGGTDLDAWGFDEYTKRGSGISFTTGSVFGGTTSSTFVTTTSAEDVKNSSLASATEEAEKTSKITNKNHKPDHTFDEFYEATIGKDASSWVTTQDKAFLTVLNSDVDFLSVQDYRMSFNGEDLQVNDTILTSKMETLFGSNSLVTSEGLKVTGLSPITPLKVCTDETPLLVKLKDVSDELVVRVDAVKLTKDATVKINFDNPEELTSLIKKAMGYGEQQSVLTLADLKEEINSGLVEFAVKNGSDNLRVDTELYGNASAYATTYNNRQYNN